MSEKTTLISDDSFIKHHNNNCSVEGMFMINQMFEIDNLLNLWSI